MAAKRGTLLSLGIASAVLAALVPGVFDAPQAARASSVVIIETAPAAEPVIPILPQPAAPAIVPAATPAPVAPASLGSPLSGPQMGIERRRQGIPFGCERLVSPLVRSAASSVIGRCIT